MGQEVSERDSFLREESAVGIMKGADKLKYSKDFLLSLSELKHCKLLPARLDPALLRESTSESVDGAISIPASSSSRGLIRGNGDRHGHSESPPDVPEWRRPSSLTGNSLLQQGIRHADSNNVSGKSGCLQADGSGKSRHIRGDNVSSRNADRSGSNRWEPRGAVGSKERERTHSRREWDSTESGGRIHGSSGLAHSGIVSQEHDGLLGSGGPIVQGVIHQARTHEKRQFSGRTSRMGRTGEQYQAVRAIKSRREDSDSVNNETFGSEEVNNEERTEQERQRRESFEQMRKEQRKKPKDTHKTPDGIWTWDNGQINEPSSPGTPQSSSSKEDTSKARSKPVTTPSTPRLLIPPGFSKVTLQKASSGKENNETMKNIMSSIEDEIVHSVEQISLEDDKSKEGKQEGLKIILQEKVPIESKFAHWFPIQVEHIMENPTHKGIQTNGVLKDELNGSFWSGESRYCSEGEGVVNHLGFLLGSANQAVSDHSSCRLGSAENASDSPARKDGSGLTEVSGLVISSSMKDQKGGDIEIGNSSFFLGSVESTDNSFASKVIPGLTEIPDFSTSPLSYLMPVKGQGHVLPMPNGPSLEDVERLMTATVHASPVLNNVAVKNERYISQNQSFSSGHDFIETKVTPVFLTCEDVEQSLLAQTFSSDNDDRFSSDMQQEAASISIHRETVKSKIDHMFYSTDDITGNASQHIMSLLQKKNEDSSKMESENASICLPGHAQILEGHESRELPSHTAEILSLETLFGKSFANELRSVVEPVSSKVADNSGYVAKQNGLHHLGDVFSSKQADHRHFDPTKSGGYLDVLSERQKLGVSMELDIRDDAWSNTVPHRQVQVEKLAIDNNSVKGPIDALFVSDFGEPKLSGQTLGHLHQPHFSGHYPSSHLPHEKAGSPVHAPHFFHETMSHGVSMYPQNRLHANFIQPNSSMQGQFSDDSDDVGYTVKMPSFGMGYYLNHPMLGPSGLDISVPSDGRVTRDLNQVSQDIAGFHPYQHPVPAFFPDRTTDYGSFGSGVAHPGIAQSMSSSTLGKFMETRDFPYPRGFDGYALSNRKPG